MKRIAVVHSLLFYACLLSLSIPTSLYAAKTIPIADGNTWVYQHVDTVKALRTYVLSSKTGLFFMRMDSVVTRVDTVFFTITTIDSGIYQGGSPYYDRSVNNYMIINGDLYLRDTTNGSWHVSIDENVIFVLHRDTSYKWNSEWFGKIGSGYDTAILCSRHSDSMAVIVNGLRTSRLYRTDTSFFWSETAFDTLHAGGNVGRLYDTTRNDTMQWLDSVGVFLHVNGFDYWSYYNTASSRLYVERYSLLSFNGTPISIAPSVKVNNGSSVASRVPSNRHRKVIWLGSGPYRRIKPSAEYLNLQGRKLEGVKPAQVLIKKKKPASNAE
jgi:hypothetical protein